MYIKYFILLKNKINNINIAIRKAKGAVRLKDIIPINNKKINQKATWGRGGVRGKTGSVVFSNQYEFPIINRIS